MAVYGSISVIEHSVLQTLGLTLVLHRLTECSSQRDRRLFNLSTTGLFLLTTILLLSASKRLLLYEYAYGFTELRIYPHVFMVWLGVLLVWFVISLWWRPQRFAVGLLVTAFGFIKTLNLMNPDALIVRQNYSRYQTQGSAAFSVLSTASEYRRHTPIDVYYLTTLSNDAVPELLDIIDDLDGYSHRVLDEHLAERQQAMQQDERWRQWQAFHIFRHRAYRLLTQYYGAQAQILEDS